MNAKITPGGTGYLEHLPPDYAINKSRTYPLLVFLHGKGEVGNGTTELNKVKSAGIPKIIEAGHNMTFTVNGKSESFIVIAPQLGAQKGGWWPDVQKEIYDYLLKTYRVDKSRIYLTGLSLGGNGTYIGLAETPNIFAAGVVVAGYSNAQSAKIAERRIPVWGFHGEKDTIIKYGDGWTEFMRTQWYAKDTLKVDITKDQLWTAYPNTDHNAWDKAYTTDHSLQNPNIYEWLLSKSKAGVVAPPVVEPPVVVEPPPVVPPVESLPVTLEAGPDRELLKSAVYFDVPVMIKNLPVGIYKVKVSIGDISDEFNLTIKP